MTNLIFMTAISNYHSKGNTAKVANIHAEYLTSHWIDTEGSLVHQSRETYPGNNIRDVSIGGEHQLGVHSRSAPFIMRGRAMIILQQTA